MELSLNRCLAAAFQFLQAENFSKKLVLYIAVNWAFVTTSSRLAYTVGDEKE